MHTRPILLTLTLLALLVPTASASAAVETELATDDQIVCNPNSPIYNECVLAGTIIINACAAVFKPQPCPIR